jgi:hypothetical protein
MIPPTGKRILSKPNKSTILDMILPQGSTNYFFNTETTGVPHQESIAKLIEYEKD